MDFSGHRGDHSSFVTTQWTIVLGAGKEDEEGRRCLGDLCLVYWRPLYRFARRLGNSPEDSEDLVQGFFAVILERGPISGVSPEGGRFRAYFLAAFKKHLAEEWRHSRRIKRGGGNALLSLDWESEERGWHLEPSDDRSPDRLFDQDWARSLLDSVVEKLGEGFRAEGREDQFEAMRGSLTLSGGRVDYAGLSARLGLREGAARVAVHRFRKQFRHLLRKQVAETLLNDDSVEDEMKALFFALSEGH